MLAALLPNRFRPQPHTSCPEETLETLNTIPSIPSDGSQLQIEPSPITQPGLLQIRPKSTSDIDVHSAHPNASETLANSIELEAPKILLVEEQLPELQTGFL
jgi:hypothetical protein